jgi:drug/metabolite transporter (DMT)-like permease
MFCSAGGALGAAVYGLAGSQQGGLVGGLLFGTAVGLALGGAVGGIVASVTRQTVARVAVLAVVGAALGAAALGAFEWFVDIRSGGHPPRTDLERTHDALGMSLVGSVLGGIMWSLVALSMPQRPPR